MVDIDAVLLLSFGGPEAPDQVRPFLERVAHGRGVPPERLAQVEQQYLAVGGCSPINEQNRMLRAAMADELATDPVGDGRPVPVYWGNRNWHPFLADTLRQMRDDGIGTAAVVVTSAYSSYSGCRQYREDLAEASAEVAAEGQGPAPVLLKVRRYFDHPAFIEVMADNVVTALGELPPGGPTPTLVFTTHSIPVSSAVESGPPDDPTDTYLSQHQFVAARLATVVGDRIGVDLTWDLVFQSRSGPPSMPWLEPDICEHLTALA
ncbi:MAG: ferrochelatase, partial [Actinomycetes bacterium]